MKLSIVIPAYNEAENIPALYSELSRQIRAVPQVTDYEIIFVDDHSTDNTFDGIRTLGDKRVRAYRLSRRSGSHTAIRAGLHAASGEAVLCLSADGQEDPEVLKEMIARWNDGNQIVWGLRKNRQGESPLVRLPATIFYRVLKMAGAQHDTGVDLSRADFYLLDRVVVDALNACPERKTSLFGMINWMGFQNGWVEYERRSRRAGQSKWNFSARMNLARDWIMSFSGAPLTLVSWFGCVALASGLVCAGAILCRLLRGVPAGMDLTILCAVLMIGGVHMLALGIIGGYLWRGVEESRMRPLYFIERKI